MADKKRISLVGPGAVGLTLARFLQNKGYPIVSVIGRTPASNEKVERYLGHVAFSTELKDALPDSDIVLLCVSDKSLEPVCGKLSGLAVKNKYFYHTSGFLSYHQLNALEEKDAETGSIHPLQSFVHVEESIQSLPGTYYAVEGTDKAVEMARNIVNDLEGRSFSINSENKLLYHSAACISANYLVSVLRVVEIFFKKAGVNEENIIPAITGLLKGILKNVQNRGVLDSITGPVSRGDHETLKLQLETIRKHLPQHLPIFRALSLQCANAVFEKAHVNPDLIDEIVWILERNLMEDSISFESEEKVPQSNHNS